MLLGAQAFTVFLDVLQGIIHQLHSMLDSIVSSSLVMSLASFLRAVEARQVPLDLVQVAILLGSCSLDRAGGICLNLLSQLNVSCDQCLNAEFIFGNLIKHAFLMFKLSHLLLVLPVLNLFMLELSGEPIDLDLTIMHVSIELLEAFIDVLIGLHMLVKFLSQSGSGLALMCEVSLLLVKLVLDSIFSLFDSL